MEHKLLFVSPLKRAIQKMVQNRLADSILAGELGSGDTAVVDFDGDGWSLTVRHEQQHEPAEALA